ncbi:MAG: RNA polymerase sigma factor [Tissierellia bacterium]|nr:RNA polymerase sigma factor [Tissierellia bacterium]
MLLFTMVMNDEPNNLKQNNIDEKLFKRIADNDMQALEELYHLTERTLYAYLLSIVKNHDETLDIMQQTYIKIMSSAHLYKPQGKPLAWIFTIAKNLHLSNLRKGKKEIYLDSDEISNNAKFSYITNNDDKIVLETVLKILDQEERKIVMLYAVSGLKHREIAESIGLKLSTTLSKYHRALKKIRKHLIEGGEGYEEFK